MTLLHDNVTDTLEPHKTKASSHAGLVNCQFVCISGHKWIAITSIYKLLDGINEGFRTSYCIRYVKPVLG